MKIKKTGALALGKEFQELFPSHLGYKVTISSLVNSEQGEYIYILVYHDQTMGSWEFAYRNGTYNFVRMFPLGLPFAVQPGKHRNMNDARTGMRSQAIVVSRRRTPSFVHKVHKIRIKLEKFFFDAMFTGHLPAFRYPLATVVTAVRRYCEEHILAEPFINYEMSQKRTRKLYQGIGFTEAGEYDFGQWIPGSPHFVPGSAQRKKFRRPKK